MLHPWEAKAVIMKGRGVSRKASDGPLDVQSRIRNDDLTSRGAIMGAGTPVVGKDFTDHLRGSLYTSARACTLTSTDDPRWPRPTWRVRADSICRDLVEFRHVQPAVVGEVEVGLDAFVVLILNRQDVVGVGNRLLAIGRANLGPPDVEFLPIALPRRRAQQHAQMRIHGIIGIRWIPHCYKMLSLPWFATDLGAGVAEMVDAEACQVSGRKPVPVRLWSPVPPHLGDLRDPVNRN